MIDENIVCSKCGNKDLGDFATNSIIGGELGIEFNIKDLLCLKCYYDNYDGIGYEIRKKRNEEILRNGGVFD